MLTKLQIAYILKELNAGIQGIQLAAKRGDPLPTGQPGELVDQGYRAEVRSTADNRILAEARAMTEDEAVEAAIEKARKAGGVSDHPVTEAEQLKAELAETQKRLADLEAKVGGGPAKAPAKKKELAKEPAENRA